MKDQTKEPMNAREKAIEDHMAEIRKSSSRFEPPSITAQDVDKQVLGGRPLTTEERVMGGYASTNAAQPSGQARTAMGAMQTQINRPFIIDALALDYTQKSLHNIIQRAQNLGDLDRETIVGECLAIEQSLTRAKPQNGLEIHTEPKNFAEELVEFIMGSLEMFYRAEVEQGGPPISRYEYMTRMVFDFLKRKDCCLPKVRPGEPIFVLRGQDITAPTIVAEWVASNRGTAHREKILTALDDVIQMYQWQRDNYDVVKRAD